MENTDLSTIDLLLIEINKHGDFPAMARSVGLNNVSVGMIYVDGAKDGVAILRPAVLNYLKVLRGQAVLAIKQKAARRPTRQFQVCR